MLIQGIKSGVIIMPLHIVYLYTELLSRPLMIGAMFSLPFREISLILGNDLAGNQVMTDPCVCAMLIIAPDQGCFPSCEVT